MLDVAKIPAGSLMSLFQAKAMAKCCIASGRGVKLSHLLGRIEEVSCHYFLEEQERYTCVGIILTP